MRNLISTADELVNLMCSPPAALNDEAVKIGRCTLYKIPKIYPKISSIQFANKNKINRSRKSNLIAPLSRSRAALYGDR